MVAYVGATGNDGKLLESVALTHPNAAFVPLATVSENAFVWPSVRVTVTDMPFVIFFTTTEIVLAV